MLKNAYNKLQHPKLKERRFEEIGTTKRNEFHRDFTRILYSASFRRLQGKMQILGIQNDAFSSELSINKYDINLKIN